MVPLSLGLLAVAHLVGAAKNAETYGSIGCWKNRMGEGWNRGEPQFYVKGELILERIPGFGEGVMVRPKENVQGILRECAKRAFARGTTYFGLEHGNACWLHVEKKPPRKFDFAPGSCRPLGDSYLVHVYEFRDPITTTTGTVTTTTHTAQQVLHRRIDGLEKLLDSAGETATKEELVAVASALKALEGEQAATAKSAADAQATMATRLTALEKRADAADAATEELAALKFAVQSSLGTLVDGLKAVAAPALANAPASPTGGTADPPSISTAPDGKGLELQSAGAVTVTTGECGTVDLCAVIKGLDEVRTLVSKIDTE